RCLSTARACFIYLNKTMIEFRLDPGSGVMTYWQIVQQVRQAIRVGRLRPGDQLPTVREVVAKLAINPNTVLKAYRELDRDGLVTSRPGQGTFVVESPTITLADGQEDLRRDFARWVRSARQAGLDMESIKALIAVTLDETAQSKGVA